MIKLFSISTYTLMIMFVTPFAVKAAASSTDALYYRQWAEAPYSKCTSVTQKMACVLAQAHCRTACDAETQEAIQEKRRENRLNADYTLPLLKEKPITPKEVAIVKQLLPVTDKQ